MNSKTKHLCVAYSYGFGLGSRSPSSSSCLLAEFIDLAGKLLLYWQSLSERQDKLLQNKVTSGLTLYPTAKELATKLLAPCNIVQV